MKTMIENQFAADLAANIRSYIRQARRDGTVSMSVENLMQCVKAPPSSLDGAPRGTNAGWTYAQMFREICGLSSIASFIQG